MALFVKCEPAYCAEMVPKAQNKLTSLQCRMARAGLKWTMQDLMDRTSLGRMTITRFENDLGNSSASTRASLRRAFEEAGVEFVEDYGVHIRRADHA